MPRARIHIPVILALFAALWLSALPAPCRAADHPAWWAKASRSASDHGYKLLGAKGMKGLLDSGEKFLLVDVRPDYEYDEGHIPGAENLEFHLGDRSKLKPAKEKKLRKLLGPDKTRKVVIYCRSFKCLRSSIAAKWAVRLGYSNIYRFAGGWYGWLGLTNPKRAANTRPPQVKLGDAFPACSLVVLQSKNDPPYLGLNPKTRRFALTEVKSPYLLVLLYSELCFACIEELPFYRSMYQATEKDPELKGRLKIIGMGAGSKKRKVAAFRKKNHVPFPLFADEDKEVFGCLGKPVLPVSYLLKADPEVGMRIIMILPGHVKKPGKLLCEIKAAIRSKSR